MLIYLKGKNEFTHLDDYALLSLSVAHSFIIFYTVLLITKLLHFLSRYNIHLTFMLITITANFVILFLILKRKKKKYYVFLNTKREHIFAFLLFSSLFTFRLYMNLRHGLPVGWDTPALINRIPIYLNPFLSIRDTMFIHYFTINASKLDIINIIGRFLVGGNINTTLRGEFPLEGHVAASIYLLLNYNGIMTYNILQALLYSWVSITILSLYIEIYRKLPIALLCLIITLLSPSFIRINWDLTKNLMGLGYCFLFIKLLFYISRNTFHQQYYIKTWSSILLVILGALLSHETSLITIPSIFIFLLTTRILRIKINKYTKKYLFLSIAIIFYLMINYYYLLTARLQYLSFLSNKEKQLTAVNVSKFWSHFHFLLADNTLLFFIGFPIHSFIKRKYNYSDMLRIASISLLFLCWFSISLLFYYERVDISIIDRALYMLSMYSFILAFLIIRNIISTSSKKALNFLLILLLLLVSIRNCYVGTKILSAHFPYHFRGIIPGFSPIISEDYKKGLTELVNKHLSRYDNEKIILIITDPELVWWTRVITNCTVYRPLETVTKFDNIISFEHFCHINCNYTIIIIEGRIKLINGKKLSYFIPILNITLKKLYEIDYIDFYLIMAPKLRS